MQQQQAVLAAGWDDVAQHLFTSSSMQQVEEQVSHRPHTTCWLHFAAAPPGWRHRGMTAAAITNCTPFVWYKSYKCME
jgi:hypothetical protein